MAKAPCAGTVELPKEHCQLTWSHIQGWHSGHQQQSSPAHVNCFCPAAFWCYTAKCAPGTTKGHSAAKSLSAPNWCIGLCSFSCAVVRHSSHCSHLKDKNKLLWYPIVVQPPSQILIKLCRITPELTTVFNFFPQYLGIPRTYY